MQYLWHQRYAYSWFFLSFFFSLCFKQYLAFPNDKKKIKRNSLDSYQTYYSSKVEPHDFCLIIMKYTKMTELIESDPVWHAAFLEIVIKTIKGYRYTKKYQRKTSDRALITVNINFILYKNFNWHNKKKNRWLYFTIKSIQQIINIYNIHIIGDAFSILEFNVCSSQIHIMIAQYELMLYFALYNERLRCTTPAFILFGVQTMQSFVQL